MWTRQQYDNFSWIMDRSHAYTASGLFCPVQEKKVIEELYKHNDQIERRCAGCGMIVG